MHQSPAFARIALGIGLLQAGTPADVAAADAVAASATLAAAATTAGPGPEATTDADADAARARRDVNAMPAVEVIGTAERLREQPGSATILDQDSLQRARTLTVNEALRRVPGVHVRDEEGMGMRPNIGIRGQNPTRSTKTLLLEDGLPAAYAPYGDNASYYHAPFDRYARIEVLKGAGMLRFGPQLTSGVVNYITPDPPDAFGGYAQLMAGNRDYFNGHLSLGGGGALFDLIRKQGDGARDNIALEQTDLNAKYVAELGGGGALTLRANWIDEDSQVTYSGITDAELAAFGRAYNPFANDEFDTRRRGASATHEIALGDNALLNTSVYWFNFDRDWWRQSSTTTDTQCGNAFRDARFRGEAVDPDACDSRQGRLREYYSRGIEPRLETWARAFGAEHAIEAGVRFHGETQQRRQVNAASPDGSSGALVELNRRTTDAVAAYLSDRMAWGAFALQPIVRFESIDYARENQLSGAAGEETIDQWIPGLGFTWDFGGDYTVFGGVHRGFSPPRAEDLIDNSGGTVDVDAEESLNLELGVRGSLGQDLALEAAWFRSDFSNQVVVGSIAGGNTPLAQGETLYQGAELALDWRRDGGLGLPGTPYARAALTWLGTAEQRSPFLAVSNNQPVAGSGSDRRLPYAPEGLATLAAGYRQGAWDGLVEVQAVDAQYADFANTALPVENGSGQLGRIAGYAIWNLTLNWIPDPDAGWSAFVAVKNAGDREYIVDRTRGIQLGNPRQYVAGLRYAF
ncbi:MAG TPA: TonB-dependent receptor plug domain-containing protein [Pseudomonadota bacterium]|nr:TonB-dependent receptor plug domain-containing protein [Pseudomonadota bacterium]